MPRDPRYDILFEPIQLGPKTMKNRFYQVPHCNWSAPLKWSNLNFSAWPPFGASERWFPGPVSDI